MAKWKKKKKNFPKLVPKILAKNQRKR
jgi:hypothetical protein